MTRFQALFSNRAGAGGYVCLRAAVWARLLHVAPPVSAWENCLVTRPRRELRPHHA